MKYNNIYTICKVILFAVMIFSLDVHCASAFSKAGRAQIRKNKAQFRSKFIKITKEKLIDLSYGIITGFVNQKIQAMTELKNLLKEGFKLTKDTFKNVSQNCIDNANQSFQENRGPSDEANEHFNTFVSVIDESQRERIVNQYIEACEKGDAEQIKWFTEKQLNRLYSKLNEKSEEGIHEREKAKSLISAIKNEDSYFKRFKSDSICPYVVLKETWTGLVVRYTTFAADIFSCYSNSLAESIFKEPTAYKHTFFKLFQKGLTAFYGFNPFKLARIIYQVISGLWNGNTPYFEAGRILGNAIGESLSITGLSGLKKRRRF